MDFSFFNHFVGNDAKLCFVLQLERLAVSSSGKGE